MDVVERLRRFENLHVALWLIKDTCWMLEIRWLGSAMVIPTVAMAIFISFTSRRHNELFINLAVLCWIIANSMWMISEFYFNNVGRYYSLIPFSIGLILVALYYAKRLNIKYSGDQEAEPGVPKD